MTEFKIHKVIGAHDIDQYTKAGWSIEEAFFQDEPAIGSGSTTLAGTDQNGIQQWNLGEAPVVALSRRFYVVSRTEEVDRAEKIAEQKKHIDELEKNNNELKASVEGAQKSLALEKEAVEMMRVSRNRFSAESETSNRALNRIKKALGQERFDELLGEPKKEDEDGN